MRQNKTSFKIKLNLVCKFVLIILLLAIGSTSCAQPGYNKTAYRFMRKMVPQLVKKQDQLVPKISRYEPIKEYFINDLLSMGEMLPKELAPELTKANQEHLLQQYNYWVRLASLDATKLGLFTLQIVDSDELSFQTQVELLAANFTRHAFFPPLFTLDGKYAFFYHIQFMRGTSIRIYKKGKGRAWNEYFYMQIFKT